MKKEILNYTAPRTSPHSYKLDHLLLMLVVTVFIVCDTTAFRVTSFWGTVIPVSGLILPVVFALGDIVTEVYGYSISRKMIWNTIGCQLVFSLLISFALSFSSPEGNLSNLHYSEAFKNIIWTSITSCFSVTVGMFINSILMSYTKVKFYGRSTLLRTILSSSVSEFALCFVAYNLLYLWSSKSLIDIWGIVISVWVYKVIFAVIASPFVSLSCRLLKYFESIDVYDTSVTYNPFMYMSNTLLEVSSNQESFEGVL